MIAIAIVIAGLAGFVLVNFASMMTRNQKWKYDNRLKFGENSRY
jgi:hypothetical protein